VIVLDACRTNPYLSRGRRTSRGLADIPHTANTLVAFSATAGQTADDGPLGGNSPYASSFAESISSSYLPLELMFNRITQSVAERTARLQRPEYRVGLAGFYCISECTFRDPSNSGTAHPGASGLLSRGNCATCFAGKTVQLSGGRKLWVASSVTSMASWQSCVDQLACVAPKQINEPNQPVTGVSWDEIQAFTTWLYNVTGKSYRLPTTDEWDAVLSLSGQRPGPSNPYRELPTLAAQPDAILFDVGVREWTSSCGSLTDGTCDGRIVRGRSWRDGDVDSKASEIFSRASRGDAIGFRVVLDQSPGSH
jgi:hypothetical protein